MVATDKLPSPEECLNKDSPLWLPLSEVRMAAHGRLSRSYDAYLQHHPNLPFPKYTDRARPCCGHFGGSTQPGTPQHNPWAGSGRCGRAECKWPR